MFNKALYILDGKKPVPAKDVIQWAKWLEFNDRNLFRDKIHEVTISTIFLGIDLGHGQHELPLLFETMIFGGYLDGYCCRAGSWSTAKIIHRNMVKEVKRTFVEVVNGGVKTKTHLGVSDDQK